jgi:ABC-type transporter Mla subunit MlaD
VTEPPDPDTRAEEPIAGAPRWVKVFGIIALLVVLLFVVLLVTGRGGDHGPGRHGIAAHGQQQP